MPDYEPIQRVRIYLSERDKSVGQPLYLVVLERLQREGATGATVTRGIAGFGAGHQQRTGAADDFSQAVPIVIEWVDRAERVARVLPLLDALLPDALITIEDLRVYRGVLRASDLFGDRTVGDVMARDVAAAGRQMLLSEAVQLMLERGQTLLPVLDEQERVIGVISGGDLSQRAGMSLPLRLLAALTPAERAEQLAALPTRTLADAMTADPRVMLLEGSIPLAVGTLVEWGLDALPVIDREGRFAGLFGMEQALRAALASQPAADSRVRDAEPPTPVRLVMQMVVPTVAPETPVAVALAQLLGVSERFLAVVEAGKPVGLLTDTHVLSQLGGAARAAWLAALRTPAAPLSPLFETTMADQTARDLAEPAPLIEALASQDHATLMLLDTQRERVLVVDENGRLEGLLARRGLLRALAQTSAR